MATHPFEVIQGGIGGINQNRVKHAQFWLGYNRADLACEALELAVKHLQELRGIAARIADDIEMVNTHRLETQALSSFQKQQLVDEIGKSRAEAQKWVARHKEKHDKLQEMIRHRGKKWSAFCMAALEVAGVETKWYISRYIGSVVDELGSITIAYGNFYGDPEEPNSDDYDGCFTLHHSGEVTHWRQPKKTRPAPIRIV